MSLAYSDAVGEAAHTAMCTLVIVRRHQAGCKQCQHDENWCNTFRSYQETYKREAATWEKLARRAALLLEVTA